MSRKCPITGKKPRAGSSISKSHRRTKRRFYPNLQTVRAVDERGVVRKMRVSTTAIKSGLVTKAVKGSPRRRRPKPEET
jgi:large subunit ribosomal protein L28